MSRRHGQLSPEVFRPCADHHRRIPSGACGHIVVDTPAPLAYTRASSLYWYGARLLEWLRRNP